MFTSFIFRYILKKQKNSIAGLNVIYPTISKYGKEFIEK